MILKHHHEKNFTILPNKTLRDTNLSLVDVGLLCYMLSLPNDWDFSLQGLNVAIPNNGVSSISNSVRRLENAGYIKRIHIRSESGRYAEVRWIVSDEPIYEDGDFAKNSSTVKLPNYKKYISSEEWHDKRLQRLKIDHFQCQLCGTAKNLNVHHITYERLGCELMDDLITLCKECHANVHDADINGKSST